MSLDADINAIKKQIKDWEHAFIEENTRQPSKRDVKENSKVSKLYKVYKALKNKQKVEVKVLVKPTNDAIDNIKGLSDDEFDKDAGNSSLDVFLRHNTELGPTPQAGGKVLSIFDLNMTPPDSSPLKDKQQSNVPTIGNTEFKTPTKVKILNQATPLKSERKSFMERINMIQNSSPIKTPNRPNSVSMQTPQYLNHNIKKFEISQKADISPFNIPEQSSPLKHTPISTPVLSKISFQVSPSPFKRKGFLGSKKLLDVFNEHQNIQIDEEEGFISEESDDEPIVEGQSPLRKRKAKTQKRTTRRWKMKPHIEEAESDNLQKKNIHRVLQEINEGHEKKLEKMMNTNENETDSDDEFPKEIRKTVKSTGRKVAPISHNYKRLKIHYKKGNNKWGRRR